MLYSSAPLFEYTDRGKLLQSLSQKMISWNRLKPETFRTWSWSVTHYNSKLIVVYMLTHYKYIWFKSRS